MGLFDKYVKAPKKPKSVDFDSLSRGAPRKYLLSATYQTGEGRKNFMMREIVTDLDPRYVRSYAKKLFWDDIKQISCRGNKEINVMLTGEMKDVRADPMGDR